MCITAQCGHVFHTECAGTLSCERSFKCAECEESTPLSSLWRTFWEAGGATQAEAVSAPTALIAWRRVIRLENQLEDSQRHLEIARDGMRQDAKQAEALAAVERRLERETREETAELRVRRERGLQMAVAVGAAKNYQQLVAARGGEETTTLLRRLLQASAIIATSHHQPSTR